MTEPSTYRRPTVNLIAHPGRISRTWRSTFAPWTSERESQPLTQGSSENLLLGLQKVPISSNAGGIIICLRLKAERKADIVNGLVVVNLVHGARGRWALIIHSGGMESMMKCRIQVMLIWWKTLLATGGQCCSEFDLLGKVIFGRTL